MKSVFLYFAFLYQFCSQNGCDSDLLSDTTDRSYSENMVNSQNKLTAGEVNVVRSHRRDGSALVINTWNLTRATEAAWKVLSSQQDSVSSILSGCRLCQDGSCFSSIGAGGSPDENSETTLDAMIMDGRTMDVGSVGCLREVQDAIGVAHAVMKFTKHTLLVGELATEFAVSLGFERRSLQSPVSKQSWQKWRKQSCQPNFWQNVSPDPGKSCGPYTPNIASWDIYSNKVLKTGQSVRYNKNVDSQHHDTLGMVVVDYSGSVASGTTTNGANHKIPGRVGDSPIAGAGSYAENGKGGAAATGDGDVMMRFLPSYNVVQLMGQGLDPTTAAQQAVAQITKFYPQSYSALIAANTRGQYGAACHKFGTFPFNIISADTGNIQTLTVNCTS